MPAREEFRAGAAGRWLRRSIAIALLLFAQPAHADVAAGVVAYERGDYQTALAEFRQAAEQGHGKTP